MCNPHTAPAMAPNPERMPAHRQAYASLRSDTSGAIDQPSAAMWCTAPTSTCSSSAMRNSSARNGISVLRSNVWRAAASMASCSRAVGHPVASMTSPTMSPARGRQHLLERDTVGLGEYGAQRFVAADDITKGRAQRVDIQLAAPVATPPPCCRPEKVLAGGRGTTAGFERTTTEPPRAARRPPTAYADPHLHRDGAASWATVGASNTACYCYVSVQYGVDRGDHAHRRNRVPAEVEEGVVDARPARLRGPGRRCRPRSPRWDWWGRGNDRLSVYSGAGRARVSSLPLTVIGSASQHHDRRRHHVAAAAARSSARAQQASGRRFQ